MSQPSGADIVADALKYQGAGYVFGGAPGPSGRGSWDCSSFVNAVVGRDLGMAIPGYAAGSYHGQAHGPDVLAWASWKGAATLPKGQPPAAGDLCLWPGSGANGHMGIATGPATMISALDPALGTRVSPVQGYGPAGISVVYRRITGTGAPVASSGSTSGSGLADLILMPIMAGLGVGVGIAAVVVGAVLVVGAAGAVLVAAAMARAGSGSA